MRKITIFADQLHRAVDAVRWADPKGSSMGVRRWGIHLRAEGDHLTATVTDSHVWATFRVPLPFHQVGVLCLDLKALRDHLVTAPPAQVVELPGEVPVLEPSRFPFPPLFESAGEFPLQRKGLREALAYVDHAAQKRGEIWWGPEEIAASDGPRLAIAPFPTGLPRSIALPLKLMEGLRRQGRKSTNEIKVQLIDSAVRFTCGEESCVGVILRTFLPDYKLAVPTETPLHFNFNAKTLLADLPPGDERFTLALPNLKISFDARNLREAVRALKSPTVQMRAAAPDTPVIFSSPRTSAYEVIMPMRPL